MTDLTARIDTDPSLPATTARSYARRRMLRIALGWLVAAAFITLAFRRVSLGAVVAALRNAHALPLWIAMFALAAGFTARIIRWWWMLRTLEPDLPLRECVRPYLVSIAINNTVPLRVGDIVRAVGFRSTLRSSPMAVIGTLLVERLLDVLVLMVLLFAGLTALGRSVVPRPFLVGGFVIGAGATIGLLSLVLIPHVLRRVATAVVRAAPLSDTWRRRILELSDQFFTSLSIVRPPSRALALLGMTVLAWALEGSAYACVAWSLHADGSPFAPWFALATGTLATMIPSSPGYVGTFDYFAVRGLTAFGADHVIALSVALLTHLLLWLPVTLVGALYLVLPGARRVRNASPSAVASAEGAA